MKSRNEDCEKEAVKLLTTNGVPVMLPDTLKDPVCVVEPDKNNEPEIIKVAWNMF